jgi:hypothetical protein
MPIVVGNVLVRHRTLAPFVVDLLEHWNGPEGPFRITRRKEIQPDGSWVWVNRGIESSNLNHYGYISDAYMDAKYVEWAMRHRGGLYMIKPPPKVEPPKKPYPSQLEIVKAVYFRQHREVNPQIPVEVVERMWNKQYMPLYRQMCYELCLAVDTHGQCSLNYDPHSPVIQVPATYQVNGAKPYVK